MSAFENSCRILIVSSSKKLSSDLANRIKSTSGDDTLVTSNDELNNIVWNIKNKYYTASVHFRAIKLGEFDESDALGSPALIYTWESKEAYNASADIVATLIASMEPEVALAIGPNVSDDSVNLDDYFSDRGMEYVEIHADEKKGASESDGLRRAVDALSTIMWPTMVRSQSSGKSRNAQAAGFNLDETDLDVLNLMASSNKTNLQREMEALEKWLEDDDVDIEPETSLKPDENDPWSFSSTSSSKAVKKEEEQDSTSPLTVNGFDDDFADYVSAPPPADPSNSSSQQIIDNDDPDAELPSQSEVRETSKRIFRGTAPTDVSSSPALFSRTEDPEEGSSDSPSFDLSRVLSALQGMKEEIATIPDERERRRAAAKVALGLVYGLEGSSDELDFGV